MYFFSKKNSHDSIDSDSSHSIDEILSLNKLQISQAMGLSSEDSDYIDSETESEAESEITI